MCVTLHPLSSFSIRMQKAFLLLFLFLFPSSNVSTRTATPEKKVATSVPAPQKMDGEQLFEDMQLGGVVNFLAFRQAVAGYNLIKQKSKSILTLIDFTKSSTEKRLFVFDMEQKKMLYSSVVSHGKNSGENYATSFSNEVGSYKSSLGFYLTGNTYQGRNGYSLLLDGLEKGINDRARERAIVVHGAAYANPSVCKSGRLGRSFGCPALPQALTKPIINTIKGEAYSLSMPIIKSIWLKALFCLTRHHKNYLLKHVKVSKPFQFIYSFSSGGSFIIS